MFIYIRIENIRKIKLNYAVFQKISLIFQA